jgi:hypothetical protein
MPELMDRYMLEESLASCEILGKYSPAKALRHRSPNQPKKPVGPETGSEKNLDLFLFSGRIERSFSFG